MRKDMNYLEEAIIIRWGIFNPFYFYFLFPSSQIQHLSNLTRLWIWLILGLLSSIIDRNRR